jgi:hypothetical protein
VNRNVVYFVLMCAIVVVVPLAFLEGLVRIVSPQIEVFPRFRTSLKYGHESVPLAEITEQLPGSRLLGGALRVRIHAI